MTAVAKIILMFILEKCNSDEIKLLDMREN